MIENFYQNPDLIIVIHFISTSLMVGIIWIIQLLHYPAFHFIDKASYSAFQDFHMNRVSFIVVPTMITEFVSGVLVVLILPKYFLFKISLGILASIWIVTFLFFTKLHQSLTVGYDEVLVNKLVRLNWLRTALWTARLFILFIMSI